MFRKLVNNAARQQKFASQLLVKKQQFKAVNQQFFAYATAETVELDATLKKLLKPEVLKSIESKTDYDLIKKLNFLGQAIVRLNCASKLQLQALNSKTVFRTICTELPDPWDYYWIQVCENGSDAEKWRASMLELVDTVPVLVERCFRTMTINGVYPDVSHYNILIQSFGKLGDTQSAHFYHDDMHRCTTQKKDKKNVETWKYLMDAWLTNKDWEVGQFVFRAAQKKNAPISQEQLEKIDKLKANYDVKAGFEFQTSKTQIKPQYIKEMEEAEAANVQNAIKMAVDNIQPEMSKLVTPEELLNRKARALSGDAK